VADGQGEVQAHGGHLHEASGDQGAAVADAGNEPRAGGGAEQAGDEARHAGCVGDGVPIETHGVVERHGHGVGKGLAELEEHDEGQDGRSARTAHEVLERIDDHKAKSGREVARAGRCRLGLRLRGNEGRDQTQREQARHGGKSAVPAECAGEAKHPGAADQKCGAVAPNVGRKRRPAQVIGRKGLDAPGIDDNVLARREKGDANGGGDQQDWRETGVGPGKGKTGQDKGKLDDHQPAPPAPENRRAKLVECRRPEELERVGKSDTGSEAEGLQGGPALREPLPEGQRCQGERKA